MEYFKNIYDYFRTWGNMRFNDLPQLINTLSLLNEDFAGLDNFNKLLKSFNMFLRTSSACRGLQGSWIGAAKNKKRKLKKKI